MKKRIVDILLMLFAVAFAFFLIEMGLRLFYPQIIVCRVNYEWQDKDKELPYIPKANYKGRMILQNQFDVNLTINSDGFRALRAYGKDKAQDTIRIAILGDSFTFGWGVDDRETFSYLLEEHLKSQGKNAEIMNAGVYGYDIGEYGLWFDRVLAYKPDIIFLGFCLENDYNVTVNDTQGETTRLTTEREGLRRKLRKWVNTLHVVALVRDRLYITFPKIRNLMLAIGVNNKRDIFLKKYPESLAALMKGVEEKLKEMNAAALSRNVRFIVLLIPLKEQIYCRQEINKFSEYDIERPNQALHAILKRNAIEYFDVLPVLLAQSKKSSQKLYFDIDPHWTKYGHEAVALSIGKRYGEELAAQMK